MLDALPAIEGETSVIKAFKKISKQQLSGQLTIRSFNSPAVGWRVYFGKGKIHYATSLVANQERMDYLISKFSPYLNASTMDVKDQEYYSLISFWRSGKLSFQKLRKLIYVVTQEALIHCLNFQPAKLEFQSQMALNPILVSIAPKAFADPVREQILEWKKIREDIPSPFIKIGIENINQFYNLIEKHSNAASLTALSNPLTTLRQFPTLYELAKSLNQEPLHLAQKLQPYIQQKDLQTKPYEPPETKQDNAPVVACIDDSHAVQRNVTLILESAGYQVVSITEPDRALTTLARQSPILILMDITMPDINGYELSRLLRQSSALADVPIVMLTGRDGVVDRVRARMVGASDYITKPFNPNQLIQLVQKLTQKEQPVLS